MEIVDLDVTRASATEANLSVLPAFKSELRRQEFQTAADAGVTTPATIYQPCHRELCHFDNEVTFEIINFMELIGKSVGIHAEDIYKRFKVIGDVDAIVAETSGQISKHGLNDDLVREALLIEYKTCSRCRICSAVEARRARSVLATRNRLRQDVRRVF